MTRILRALAALGILAVLGAVWFLNPQIWWRLRFHGVRNFFGLSTERMRAATYVGVLVAVALYWAVPFIRNNLKK